MSVKTNVLIFITIYVAIIILGVKWMDSEINKRLIEQRETVDQSSFCQGGLTPEPEFCKVQY